MKCDILSIGDELLIGQTVNTNSSFIGKELSSIGIEIHRIIAISDKAEEIKTALSECLENSDLVIVTGGLGPTKDDITKKTLADYFNTDLVIHPPTLKRIEDFFAERKRPMIEANIRQAELPRNCEILENELGTAAGMLFEKDGKLIFSLPGVPYEMEGLLREKVIPVLKSRFKLESMFYKTILFQGIGESFLAERIEKWESKVRDAGFGLAYLPSPGIVKLRITSYQGKSREKEIEDLFAELLNDFPINIFGKDEDTLTEVLGNILRKNKIMIGTVESCTGGALARALTLNTGSSDFFVGSLLTYSNEIKEKLAKVKNKDLEEFGAVSQQVVEQMANNGRKILDVDVCVSTSGVAGPTGGSEDKPVGTVWIAVSTKERTISKKFLYGTNRERNVQMTVLSALNLVRCELLNLLD